ncbi:hypothetical protein B0H14DRAFT_2576427 [Mycena olivaceomarginata]|nr:hypothetical protein B0H14DRAFT_2576427 [Mycena olivaceomarginata]
MSMDETWIPVQVLSYLPQAPGVSVLLSDERWAGVVPRRAAASWYAAVLAVYVLGQKTGLYWWSTRALATMAHISLPLAQETGMIIHRLVLSREEAIDASREWGWECFGWYLPPHRATGAPHFTISSPYKALMSSFLFYRPPCTYHHRVALFLRLGPPTCRLVSCILYGASLPRKGSAVTSSPGQLAYTGGVAEERRRVAADVRRLRNTTLPVSPLRLDPSRSHNDECKTRRRLAATWKWTDVSQDQPHFLLFKLFIGLSAPPLHPSSVSSASTASSTFPRSCFIAAVMSSTTPIEGLEVWRAVILAGRSTRGLHLRCFGGRLPRAPAQISAEQTRRRDARPHSEGLGASMSIPYAEVEGAGGTVEYGLDVMQDGEGGRTYS